MENRKTQQKVVKSHSGFLIQGKYVVAKRK